MTAPTLPICESIVESADRIFDAIDRAKQRMADAMPTERDALEVMFAAYDRLRAFGWCDAIYCPKDGTVFDAIEAGSTGIFPCHYSGEWPDGHWWVEDGGDLWPSRPILFRAREGAPHDPQ
jgi:hypothetical protein